MTIPNSQFVYANSSGSTSTGVFLPIFELRDPNPYDTNYFIKQQWINTSSYAQWILVNFSTSTGTPLANWIRLNTNSGGGTGVNWQSISSNTALVSNNGYICFSGSQITLTLPLSSNVGDIIEITTRAAAGFIITQSAGQQISEGTLSSTFGGSGSVASIKTNDSLRMVCTQSSSAWTVLSSTGNLIYT